MSRKPDSVHLPVEHLHDTEAVLVADGTGDLRKGMPTVRAQPVAKVTIFGWSTSVDRDPHAMLPEAIA